MKYQVADATIRSLTMDRLSDQFEAELQQFRNQTERWVLQILHSLE